MGAGPIGLLHLQLALVSARNVIVSQTSGRRRELAERLGATVTVDPRSGDLAVAVAEVSGGVGADPTIIAVGVPALVDEAVALSRNGGRVSVFAGMRSGSAEVSANLYSTTSRSSCRGRPTAAGRTTRPRCTSSRPERSTPRP